MKVRVLEDLINPSYDFRAGDEEQDVPEDVVERHASKFEVLEQERKAPAKVPAKKGARTAVAKKAAETR